MRPREVTPGDELTFADLYSQGNSVRDIAELTGFSGATISRYLRRTELVAIDTTKTAQAAERKRVLATNRRLEQVLRSQEDAEMLRTRLWDSYTTLATGPAGVESITLPEPPIRDQADAIRAITSARLADHKILQETTTDGNSLDQAKSVLTNIFEGLSAMLAVDPNAGLDPGDKDHDYDIADDPDEQDPQAHR